MANTNQTPGIERVKLDPKAIAGYPGIKAWAGRIGEEWDPTLKGARAARLYREMVDSEPVLATVMRMIVSVLQQVETYVEPASEDALAQEAADFLEDCLGGMDCTWEELLEDALTAVAYGWAYFEQVFQKRADNRFGWDRIEIRGQDTLHRWEIDDTGRILGMWQMGPPDFRRVYIPLEKAIHWRIGGEKRNPEGRSLFRPCKRPYLFKRNLEEIEAIGIERNLAGLPVLEVPPELLSVDATEEEKAFVKDLFKMVQNIRKDSEEALLLPSEEETDEATGAARKTGFRFRLLSAGATSQIDASAPIRRYEHRMLMVFLAEFLMLGEDGGGGSHALAKDKTDFLVLSLTALLKSFLATFNRQAVALLMRLNGYPEEAWPTVEAEDIESPALAELATYVSTLIQAGAIVPDDALEAKLRRWAALPQLGETLPGAKRPAKVEPEERDLGDEEIATPAARGTAPAPTAERAEEDADLQSTALNGAQVTAAKEIVLDVVGGRLPRETAVTMLQEFFQLPPDAADRILGEVGRSFTPAAPAEGDNGARPPQA